MESLERGIVLKVSYYMKKSLPIGFAVTIVRGSLSVIRGSLYCKGLSPIVRDSLTTEGVIMYYIILYNILYNAIRYNTILYYTILYYTVLYCTVLYCTISIMYYNILCCKI